MRTVAVVLAGGAGLRLGGAVPKQFQLLGGKTLLEHSVAAFDEAPSVDDLVVVLPAAFMAQGAEILGDRYAKIRKIIRGGADRQGSTRSAIKLISQWGDGDCNVLFHDAARPLVDQRIIADCVTGLQEHLALGVVVPTADTIVALDGNAMVSVPPRESLGRCQTPQGFRLSVIRRAYQLAAADPAKYAATDDCGMVLRYLPSIEVRTIPGSERNLKITYAADLRIAESFFGSGPAKL
ncbi:MAG TPA: IspD/TarI family cytidylyltransferase [Streptosporangiaceae bacterium]|nr:IspD/TarI family cytidylyltransferase [Streptosporangiaceae bacterium]